MNVREFRKALETLHRMYASAGAKGPADDIRRLIVTLDGHDQQSVEDYVAEAKSNLALAKRPKAVRGPRAIGAVKADAETVASRYATILLEAGTDEATFFDAFEKMKKDKGAVKPVVEAVANRYLNEPSGGAYHFKFKTKAEALETIRVKFIERAQAESKRGIIERMTRWPSRG